MSILPRRAALALVLVLLTGLIAGAAAESRTYTVEDNPEVSRMIYPYRVVSESAVLYLSGEDIDLLGEETYYAGMYRLLENMEEDFAEAREVLKDYLKEEIPPIDIHTYFAETEKSSQGTGAYYDSLRREIKLLGDWEQASFSLLHEYVHYLTWDCFRYPMSWGFWSEGIAEYISRMVCTNRMARTENYGVDDENMEWYAAHGYADEEGKLDFRKLCYGSAAVWDRPEYIGEKFLSVDGRTIIMTARLQQHPAMDKMTYKQACCFMEYLVERFGEEYVFTHMNYDTQRFRGLYGKTFEDLCNEWKPVNKEKCEELGIILEPDEDEE